MSSTRRALSRAESGKSLDRAEVEALLAARDDELRRLTAVARRIRTVSARFPGAVTYSRKVFIPLTRLCRDRCHYCTFADAPSSLRRSGEPLFLSRAEVLAIARAGAAAGCKEALFTLGDRPESRWPAARQWLEEAGYESTLEYLRAMAIVVLEETGLLPHLNPGVMSWAELNRLRPVAASMGMMLETTSRRLFDEPGGAHYRSPDKDPAVRIRVIEDAGRLNIPFTTGLLIGIGETRSDRADSLLELRRIERAYGGIQEVIVQNFRAKAGTPMGSAPDLPLTEYLATIATAAVLMGSGVPIQAPPNLVDLAECRLLLDAGIADFGGISPVTPDHVNPERPWPAIDALGQLCRDAGLVLRERLTVYPHYAPRGAAESRWLDPRLLPHVRALADPEGLADRAADPVGRPWQETGLPESSGRVGLHRDIDTSGRSSERRGDFDEVYGDWSTTREAARKLPFSSTSAGTSAVASAGPSTGTPTGASAAGARQPHRMDGEIVAALKVAETRPDGLTDSQALSLLTASGADLHEVCALADRMRREAVGDEVTYVVNRNINFTNICYVGCRFCAFAQRKSDPDAYTLSLDEIAARAAEAVASGATEVCLQGGIDPALPALAYFEIARAVKRAAPGVHLHAFSPMEIMNGVARTGLSIREFLQGLREAGVDSLPGTAAEILDDEVRWILTKGKLPAAQWVEVVTTAHELGIPTTATMMYGHVDHPRHWITHLRLLAELQRRTGGFTEFVPLPFVHRSSPIYLAGVARPGPSRRDNRAVHAVARIVLTGAIDNVQCSWVKLGPDGCADVLRGGVNDLGGTLMEETISRMAGSEFGSAMRIDELAAIAEAAGRTARQRTTTYGVPAHA
ncbi:MAG: bifunctional FO biosynthesis protein CofGH [Nocardioides sp.]